MNKLRKIAFACFIGGALCVAVSVMVTPAFWWLALAAGMVGGYLSYEFKEVLRAIPTALQRTAEAWEKNLAKYCEWRTKAQPFLLLPVIIGTPVCVWIMWLLCPLFTCNWAEPSLIYVIEYDFMVLCVFFAVHCVILGLFVFLSYLGAIVSEHCYWKPSYLDIEWPEREQTLIRDGYQLMPVTYRNTARWFAKGILLVAWFFIWPLWKHLVIGIWRAICFLARFGWHLFRLIHSKERVLCAIDGTIGGVIVYLWFASGVESLPGQIILVFFGGLLGAGLGVANYEIVSKRVLHLVPNSSLAS